MIGCPTEQRKWRRHNVLTGMGLCRHVVCLNKEHEHLLSCSRCSSIISSRGSMSIFSPTICKLCDHTFNGRLAWHWRQLWMALMAFINAWPGNTNERLAMFSYYRLHMRCTAFCVHKQSSPRISCARDATFSVNNIVRFEHFVRITLNRLVRAHPVSAKQAFHRNCAGLR